MFGNNSNNAQILGKNGEKISVRQGFNQVTQVLAPNSFTPPIEPVDDEWLLEYYSSCDSPLLYVEDVRLPEVPKYFILDAVGAQTIDFTTWKGESFSVTFYGERKLCPVIRVPSVNGGVLANIVSIEAGRSSYDTTEKGHFATLMLFRMGLSIIKSDLSEELADADAIKELVSKHMNGIDCLVDFIYSTNDDMPEWKMDLERKYPKLLATAAYADIRFTNLMEI